MPLVYRCGNCGFVLHYLGHVGQDFIGVPSITDVLSKYGHMCPKCKSRLTRPSQENIIITSTNVAKAKNMLPVRVGDSYYVLSRAPALLSPPKTYLSEAPR